MATANMNTTPDTPVHVKILMNGKDENRKFKLTLKDLGATVLPDKLRNLLQIPSSQDIKFERYSDSSASYITLESTNASVYKQLYRAAKAKGKLRLRVTVSEKPSSKSEASQQVPVVPDRLTTRCYVHPYISDLSNNESSPRHSPLADLEILAEAPSPVTVKHPNVIKVEPQESVKMTPPKPYFWPVTDSPEWADSTKATFDRPTKQQTQDALRIVKEAIAARTASGGTIARDNTNDEAPVPRYFSAREACRAELAGLQQQIPAKPALQLRPKPCANFTICCNNCDGAIPDAHWHCSICDDGDFDLCQSCVERGYLCDNEEHWLIKRSVEEGKVITSKTETIGPKTTVKIEEEKEVPGAFNTAIKAEAVPEKIDASRTCNQCVQVFDESKFVTCTVCEDYDLCIPCHVAMKHGHHPNHGFEPASSETSLTKMATNFLAPGRNIRHWAICDGCDKDIYGVRHKCLNCPDWDYCSKCIKNATRTHPGHSLVALYEPIVNGRRTHQSHTGIFCDGPLCKGKSKYITGDRYKCAVCHDTDFCANCEALPLLPHNRTHPLIKIKHPIKNVSVSTFDTKEDGSAMRTLGDNIPLTSSKGTETNAPAPSANAATQVQTIAEVKPSTPKKEETKKEASIKPADLAAELNAHFVSDTITDGTVMTTGTQFTQGWTLRNPGPHTWPAGCTAYFIGGDSMLDVDPNLPSHITQIRKAIRTNTVESEVKVGDSVKFEVVMRAPEREGRAISYWRVKATDGTPFGHKLWCDIVVKKPEQEQATSKHIEDIVQHQPRVEDEAVAIAAETEPSTSQMIFPKLDKESPTSSNHEAETVARPESAPINSEDKELLEDVESLELDNDDESDEGFFTDEEYELIASGDDMEEAKNGKK